MEVKRIGAKNLCCVQGTIEQQLFCSSWVEENKTVPFCERSKTVCFGIIFYFDLKKKEKTLKENNTCSLWHVNVGFEGLDLFLLRMCQCVFGQQHFQFWSALLVWEINCSSLLTGT